MSLLNEINMSLEEANMRRSLLYSSYLTVALMGCVLTWAQAAMAQSRCAASYTIDVTVEPVQRLRGAKIGSW